MSALLHGSLLLAFLMTTAPMGTQALLPPPVTFRAGDHPSNLAVSRLSNRRAGPVVSMNFFSQFMPKPQSTPADVYRPDPAAPPVGLPKSYHEVHESAIAGVIAALAAGEQSESSPPPPRLVEVDFPPLANVNALGDGSARSEALVHEANAGFVGKLRAALEAGAEPGAGRAVAVVGCSGGSVKALEALGTGPALTLRDAQRPGALEGCGVVVCVAPSVDEHWEAAASFADGAGAQPRGVVVVNGLISNGLMPHAFFYRPMTAYSKQTGGVVRRFPGAYECYDWRGQKVDLEVGLTTLGKRALPDTAKAQLLLQGMFGQAQSS